MPQYVSWSFKQSPSSREEETPTMAALGRIFLAWFGSTCPSWSLHPVMRHFYPDERMTTPPSHATQYFKPLCFLLSQMLKLLLSVCVRVRACARVCVFDHSVLCDVQGTLPRNHHSKGGSEDTEEAVVFGGLQHIQQWGGRRLLGSHPKPELC